ncbi:MAG: transposase [Bacteroidales bacterium]|nr:transposase [Bacteroidales bacterium]MBR0291817.1 transposase [Bacteroidales bacterium]
MATPKRKFRSGIIHHCYQNTKDGFLIFYSVTDYLVHFTLLCVKAEQYGISVPIICQMPDHTHGSFITDSLESLSAFMRDTASLYSRFGQAPQCRGGQLFNRRYGCAVKIGDKKARTNIVYIGNNPVERHLVEKAEDYRWNYLAYAKSDHPFSQKLVISKASKPLLMAIGEVKSAHNRRQYLSYNFIQRLFAPLNPSEKHQLIDYIVTTYSVIDYEYASRFFDGYDEMIGAMHFNTGSEYDLNEVFTGRSDACYSKISTLLMNRLRLSDIHQVFELSEVQRADLLLDVYRQTGIGMRQIAKYLRLKVSLSQKGDYQRDTV